MDSLSTKDSPPSEQYRNARVSFVLPCLNEERSLPVLLETINAVRTGEFKNRSTEIVIADNGSTDNSVEIAESFGARIVHSDERGYGAALQAGIAAAEYEIVVFADADNTYDFSETPRLLAELERGFDLVIGSRLKGKIHRGAMPFLHRYLGTPALTMLINVLHATNGTRISDCNSGFRCFRKEAYKACKVKSTGMEFASEMLIKAFASGLKMSEVPVSLYPDEDNRIPHLKTWRDGMRHLLQIFLESPQFFRLTGASIAAASWMIILTGVFYGQMRIGSIVVFGLHSLILALMGTLFGLTIWSIGLFLVARRETEPSSYQFAINLSEDKLLWSIVALTVCLIAVSAWIFIQWANNEYQFLALEKEVLALVAIGSNLLLLATNLFTAHLIKRG